MDTKTCSQCGLTKAISEFYFNRTTHRYFAECKACQSIRRKDYKERNKEYLKEKNKEWAKANPEKVKASQLREKLRHPGRAAQRMRNWVKANPERHTENQRRQYRGWHTKAFDGYGHKCVCCGESDTRFLTLDHVDEDGAKHREQLAFAGRRGTGVKLYKWIVSHGWPKTIQVLCYNCNCGRFRNGGICPHKDPEGSSTRRKP